MPILQPEVLQPLFGEALPSTNELGLKRGKKRLHNRGVSKHGKRGVRFHLEVHGVVRQARLSGSLKKAEDFGVRSV